MKTFIATLLLVLSTFTVNQVTASHGMYSDGHYELFAEAWNQQPHRHAELAEVYWDMVVHDVAEFKTMIPVKISERASVVSVDYKDTVTTYKYLLRGSTPEPGSEAAMEANRRIITGACNDSLIGFMVINMNGSVIFEYYKNMGAPPINRIKLTAKSCGHGI